MEEEEIHTEESPLLPSRRENSLNHDSVFVSNSIRNSTSAIFSQNITISTHTDNAEQVLCHHCLLT